MRVTVDIDEAIVREVMAIFGEKNKSPALSRAIEEFVKRRKAKEFGRLIRESAFDYPAPSDPGNDSDDPSNPIPPLGS